jgi:hypothetical protein
MRGPKKKINISKEQSSWEADIHSAGLKFPSLFYNPKFHYRVQSSLPLDPITSQMNPVHILFI